MSRRPALALLAALTAGGAGMVIAAAPADWNAPPPESGRWRVSIDGAGVGDTVEHEPNAVGGGFEPVRTLPRYVEGDLALAWFPDRDWSLRASLGHRSLTFKRDRYEIGSLSLALARVLPSPHRATRLALSLGLRVNHADELYKNSWTEIGGNRLTEARLFDAHDASLSLDLASRTPIGSRLTLSTLVGIGWNRSAHRRLHAAGDDGEGCRYAIAAGDGRSELALLEPCGSLLAFNEIHANEHDLEARLNFAPSVDLEQRALLLRAGVALGYRAGRTDLSLSWRHTHHERDALDERIRDEGGTVVDSSRLLSLDVGLRASERVRLHASVQRRSTAYLDELPLLYSRFTSERFASDTLSFGLGASLSF